ncbi:MAG TPA: TraR/DksA C4-type zinc finger protein [Acidimicrobiales bacterium]|jgi:DnaK suppressor protein|nr:TraR/DksA C4-type zinc finger protein [Acidimicrobiales bacterium]
MDPQHVRQRLEEEQVRLQQVRDTFDEADESENASIGELSALDQHQADLGTETFEREKDLSILETVEAELADIDFALARLSDGTYGTCEACGAPIDEERLEVMPATRLCVKDQAVAERQARAAGNI